ncbi:MAG: MBOAT family protein [Elusimicrobia bacterium]|nr:MBOAT family protein [Candidatus Obscuribacterium magneticum]
MLFTTKEYFLFFTLTLVVFHSIQPLKPKLWFLLTASMVFYGSWNYAFIPLIFLQTSVDFFLAHLINKTNKTALRRLLLTIMIGTNLSILGFFKYLHFFADIYDGLFPQGLLGHHGFRMANLILPLGISFYTFEGMSYAIDVYRGKIKPHRSYFDYLGFIFFFPHLVSGPIVRAADFLPQLSLSKAMDIGTLLTAGRRVLIGAFKKMVIADNLAVYADAFFANPNTDMMSAWVGVLCYAFQIYFDFSGYSDMAIGCARMLGFTLAENFYWPYLARNVSEFWHRWHMSLSSWLRDYLYISLGGSRCGERRMYTNLLITMLLGGLWHGAKWTFVLWGFYHGLLLVGWHIANKHWPEKLKTFDNIFGQAFTFLAVCFGWVLFRCTSFLHAIDVSKALFTQGNGFSLLPDYFTLNLRFIFGGVVLWHLLKLSGLHEWKINVINRIKSQPHNWICFESGMLIAALLTLTPQERLNPFIYFQF